MNELIFLKLGGSLITDKTRPYTPRLDKLADLADQIAAVLSENPSLQLILGHGSGSFGHIAANVHKTRDGVHDKNGWRSFSEVWFQASSLNRLVMEALHHAHIPSLTFPPSASVMACDGSIATWYLGTIKSALNSNLLPVVYGDVVFDSERGGTILSTEDLMSHLALRLKPNRILLAGLETGVWADYPARTHLIEVITPDDLTSIRKDIGAASGADVTGGMASKVEQMTRLVQAVSGLQVNIFSGEENDNLILALRGESPGTVIKPDS
ncbi:MAG: isopentenyl phosphate kinase [Anaerolineales bacterium]|nr:isopentenyl phosphate kinase [Anaerolineales bacterium]